MALTQTQVASQSGDTNKILQLRWNHKAANEFVTVGLRHVFFWTFDGKELKVPRASLSLRDNSVLTRDV